MLYLPQLFLVCSLSRLKNIKYSVCTLQIVWYYILSYFFGISQSCFIHKFDKYISYMFILLIRKVYRWGRKTVFWRIIWVKSNLLNCSWFLLHSFNFLPEYITYQVLNISIHTLLITVYPRLVFWFLLPPYTAGI